MIPFSSVGCCGAEINVAGPGLGLSAPLDGGLLADRLKGTHLPLQTPAGAGCKEQLLGLEKAAVLSFCT